jgi:Flp pilus assembly protein TadD
MANGTMVFTIPTKSPLAKLVLGMVVLGIFGWFVYRAETDYFADHMSKIPLFGTESAILAQPSNPDYEFQLGNYWLVAGQQPELALPHFERAVRLNPYGGRYYGQLAMAYQQMGNADRANDAIGHALSVDPNTPELLWEAANIYAFLGDREHASAIVHRYALADPDQVPLAAQLAWRTAHDAQDILENVLPRGAHADLSLLTVLVRSVDPTASAKIKILDTDPNDYFVHNLALVASRVESPADSAGAETKGIDLVAAREKAREEMLRLIAEKTGRDLMKTEDELQSNRERLTRDQYVQNQAEKRQRVLDNKDVYAAAAFAWGHLMAQPEAFDFRLGLPYVQMLVDADLDDAATHAWQLLVSREKRLSSWNATGNLLKNASFEYEILNGGLDWQYTSSDLYRLAIDHRNANAGSSALLIRFNDKSVADAGIVQYVPVMPNTAYEFTGYMKADSIEGATGPRFRIQDVDAQKPYFESNDIRGTTGWTKFAGDFKTSQTAHFVAVTIGRNPGNTLIRGSVWVDDLLLRPLQEN